MEEELIKSNETKTTTHAGKARCREA